MQTESFFFFHIYERLGEAFVFAGDYFCVDIASLSHLGDVRPLSSLFSLMTNTNSHKCCLQCGDKTRLV